MIFLESICKRFEKNLNQIVDFSTTANKRYKTYKIKKELQVQEQLSNHHKN